MRTGRNVAALAASAAVLWLLAASSAVRVGWHADDVALLRLSWTARPERLEQCRPLTKEEREARPIHMRQSVECTGSLATYDLNVVIDDVAQAPEVVRGGGARGDRPIHLLRSYPTSPGERRVRVALARRESIDSSAVPPIDTNVADPTDPLAARTALEARTRRQRALTTLAPVLVLDTVLTFAPGRVVLVTYDQEARVLQARAK